MALPSRTRSGAPGYTFKLPMLGTRYPGSEWVPLRAVMGEKEASAALLLSPSTDAPQRSPQGQYTILEIEYGGFVWYLPCLDPQTSLQQPKIFTVHTRKVPVAAAPAGERPHITIPMQVIYLGPTTGPPTTATEDSGAIRWSPLKTAEDASWEESDVFNICLDPSPSQREPPTAAAPGAAPDHAAEAEERKQRNKAWKRWAAMSIDAVNEDWLRDVQSSAIKAGLRKSTDVFDKSKCLVMISGQDAPDFDVKSLEWAVAREKENSSEGSKGDWKPLPSHAYTQDFMRVTVNLLRKEGGKKLYGKEEWPLGQDTEVGANGERMQE